MTTARSRLAGGTSAAVVTEVEQLLELYGRAASPEAAPELAERVIAAVAQAVPALAAPPAPRLAGRWLPAFGPRLLSGPRRLIVRLAPVAVLTVALAAVAFASELHRSADPLPPPAVEDGPVPSSSPVVTLERSTTDDADTLGPEDANVEDGSGPQVSDGDAESDDDRDVPEEGDGAAAEDEAGEDSEVGSADPEPEASDGPDVETDAEPEAEPEPEPEPGSEPAGDTLDDTER